MAIVPNVSLYGVDHVKQRQQMLLSSTGASFVITYMTFFDKQGKELMCVSTISERGLRMESENTPSNRA